MRLQTRDTDFASTPPEPARGMEIHGPKARPCLLQPRNPAAHILLRELASLCP